MGNLPKELTLNICHQDQVLQVPEGAKVYAKSDFCENAGFYIKDKGLNNAGSPRVFSRFY